MKCFSMFSGIGGFDLALRNQGHEIIGACEIDKYARSVYAKQFPGVPIHNDATNLHAQSLSYFDVLCAGFPCQAFSIAGKRRGFEDTRGSLFFEIARIAKEKKPPYLILENVKGLLSHDKGQTFRTIIHTLDEMGYDAEWQVLNSKYFVPQNRERVYIIGHIRGQRTRQIFPIRNLCKKDTFKEKEPKECGSYSIMLMHNSQNGRAVNPEYAFALTTSIEQAIYTNKKYRRLTPLECERLQGFPDNWTKGISDTQRYKCIGNAVTVPVVEFIVKELFN